MDPRAVRGSRWARRRVVAALLVAPGLLTFSGCSPQTSATQPESATSSRPASRLLGPGEFATESAGDRRYLLNVHTPDQGSIPGTDAAIPFDEIVAGARGLPKSRSTPLAVYCRTGDMSRTAVARLSTLGYTDIVELRGGMVAWQDDGRRLLPPAT